MYRHLVELAEYTISCVLLNAFPRSKGQPYRDWSRREKAATRERVVLQEPTSVPSQVVPIDKIRKRKMKNRRL
ncbi:hypothetical protein PUN28_007962 [Cardiocondyla obscurior]|uniref:Uncharacterized protein n=1 Tax=Cardiocondyla obscurior TaxID=286306 RepID=A0AAW2FV72_9HYME